MSMKTAIYAQLILTAMLFLVLVLAYGQYGSDEASIMLLLWGLLIADIYIGEKYLRCPHCKARLHRYIWKIKGGPQQCPYCKGKVKN